MQDDFEFVSVIKIKNLVSLSNSRRRASTSDFVSAEYISV